MRYLILLALAMMLSGCTAMMMGGGGSKTYPPAERCPDGQVRTEEGCAS